MFSNISPFGSFRCWKTNIRRLVQMCQTDKHATNIHISSKKAEFVPGFTLAHWNRLLPCTINSRPCEFHCWGLVFYHQKKVLMVLLDPLRLIASNVLSVPMDSNIIDFICSDLVVDEFTQDIMNNVVLQCASCFWRVLLKIIINSVGIKICFFEIIYYNFLTVVLNNKS